MVTSRSLISGAFLRLHLFTLEVQDLVAEKRGEDEETTGREGTTQTNEMERMETCTVARRKKKPVKTQGAD